MLRKEELVVGVLPRVEYRDGSVILVLLEKWTTSVKEVCRYVKRRRMETAHFMVGPVWLLWFWVLESLLMRIKIDVAYSMFRCFHKYKKSSHNVLDITHNLRRHIP